MGKVRTLIVDDSVRFVSAAEEFLSSTAWIELMVSASSGEEALQRVYADTPDLVVADLQMPNLSGFDLTRKMKRRHPACKVVIVSIAGFPGCPEMALAAGADAFLSKGRVAVELVPLIAHLFGVRPGAIPAWQGPSR